jgi:lysyl-tRNA synthetase class 2
VNTSRAPEDWRPSASLDTLKHRARMLARIRAFFSERDILEVETPLLSQAATTDSHLASFSTQFTGPGFGAGLPLFLHTSPEFPMKRLLAAGSGSIYQICKVFRDGEAGRLHNPEFTMIEWYRVGWDYHQLMDEVAALANAAGDGRFDATNVEKLSYREAFVRYGDIDPHSASVAALEDCARRHDVSIPPGMPRDNADPWRDLLLTHLIEPHLGQGQMTFLYDYPASQAALARVRNDAPPVGERFELYIEGVEIANGFHELGDAAEQRRRFTAERAQRQALTLPMVPADEKLLAALEHGLPACAGVALGFDRLAMLTLGAKKLDDVLAFPLARA